jgi:hypothetical protein
VKDLESVQQQLVVIVRDMRANYAVHDDRDAGTVWSWRVDNWADDIDEIVNALVAIGSLLTDLAAIVGIVDADTRGGEPCPVCSEAPHRADCFVAKTYARVFPLLAAGLSPSAGEAGGVTPIPTDAERKQKDTLVDDTR